MIENVLMIMTNLFVDAMLAYIFIIDYIVKGMWIYLYKELFF